MHISNRQKLSIVNVSTAIVKLQLANRKDKCSVHTLVINMTGIISHTMKHDTLIIINSIFLFVKK